MWVVKELRSSGEQRKKFFNSLAEEAKFGIESQAELNAAASWKRQNAAGSEKKKSLIDTSKIVLEFKASLIAARQDERSKD